MQKFYVPQARQIAENICAEIRLLLAGITTTELTVADRGTRLYLDPNQNDHADTVAALLRQTCGPANGVDTRHLEGIR